MQVQYMRPFYSKVTGNKLRLVFAYQYFTIMADDKLFHFIPIEGKEVIINMDTYRIENKNDVFVFQHSNKFKRFHLYQLLTINGFCDKIEEIIASSTGNKVADIPEEVVKLASSLIDELVEFNKRNLIDTLLDNRDFDKIEKLMEG